MVLAFLEDGTLVVHESVVDASRHYEGIDVDAGVARFYDESGTPLSARFTTPNRAGKTLGLVPWVVSGTYELVPAPASGADPIALALYETSVLEPNPWFASLDALKAALAARGVVVTI